MWRIVQLAQRCFSNGPENGSFWGRVEVRSFLAIRSERFSQRYIKLDGDMMTDENELTDQQRLAIDALIGGQTRTEASAAGPEAF